jgi:hypothetical protein
MSIVSDLGDFYIPLLQPIASHVLRGGYDNVMERTHCQLRLVRRENNGLDLYATPSFGARSCGDWCFWHQIHF